MKIKLRRTITVIILVSFFMSNFSSSIYLFLERTPRTATTKAFASEPDPWKDIKILPENPKIAEDKNFMLLIQSPDEANIGDIVPISFVFNVPEQVETELGEKIPNSHTSIDMINITISDPTRANTTHFKDSYINLKNNKTGEFTYSWDTIASSTRPSSNNLHKITAQIYQKVKEGYILIGQSTRNIKILEMPNLDIKSHGFWGAYLSEERNIPLNNYWSKKLNCGDNDCNLRDEIEEKLKKAIINGDFEGKWINGDFTYNTNDKLNKKDIDELFLYANNYLARNRVGPPDPEVDEGVVYAEVFANTVLITNILGLIEETMSEEITPQTEELFRSPQMGAVFEVVNKYLTKIASYDPESQEDLEKLPIWNNIKQEITDIYDKDLEGVNGEEDIITDEEMRQFFSSTQGSKNSIKPESAKAVAPLVIAGAIMYVGFAAWSAYDLYKDPSITNWGFLGLSLIPGGAFGGIGKIGKVLKGGKGIISGVSKGIKAIRGAGSLKASFKTAVALGVSALKGSAKWLKTSAGINRFRNVVNAGWAYGGIRGAASAIWQVYRGGLKKSFMKVLPLIIGAGIIAKFVHNKKYEGICGEGWKDTLNPIRFLRSVFCSISIIIKDFADSLMCFAQNQFINSIGYHAVPILPRRCAKENSPEVLNWK